MSIRRQFTAKELASIREATRNAERLTGGEVVCKETGLTLENLTLEHFGEVDKVVVRKDETQVIGGSSFISSSVEYRFPISEEIGLMGFAFVDGGNAFIEGDVLFDASEWRYGYGGGVLWFSPFGPLQLVLGFPIDPRSFEDSPVFEFSVGGLGI